VREARARIVRIDDVGQGSTRDDRDVLVHTLRRVVAWALGLVLLAGTAGALAVAVFPLVTGGAALAVLSGSMAPGLPVGAMAFVRPVDPADVRPDDVITFQRAPDAPELVTHRVLAVDDSSGTPVFTTKGDANEDADLDPVPASALRGELWFGMPHLGRLAALLQSPKGAGLLVVLVCATIAASPGPRPATGPRRGSGAPESVAEEGEPIPDGDLAAEGAEGADARTVVMSAVAVRPGRAEPPPPARRRTPPPPYPSRPALRPVPLE
jgi:signal peptidase I